MNHSPRRLIYSLSAMLVVITALIIAQPVFAAQITGFTPTITCTSWSYTAYTLVLNRDTSGTGMETITAEVVDGDGTVLRSDSVTLPLNTYPVPAGGDNYTTLPDTDPITLNYISPAGNGLQAETLHSSSINCAPTITSGAPGNGTEGTPYTHTYTATSNHTAAITYTLTAGALPPGLTLSGAGVLSGTPTTPGTYTGTVTASNGTLPNDTQNFNITIDPAAPVNTPPTITSGAPPAGTINVAYNHTFTGTGNPAPTFTVNGALPPGITFDGVATISGTPTTAGAFVGLSVTATNGVAPDATQNFSISIGTVPVVPSTKPVVELPAPPPVPLCTTVNFDENAGMRVVAEFDSMEINCRMLVENGSYFSWNGSSLTQAAQIGNQSVLDLNIIQAVDVFSPVGRTTFEGDVVVCLRGTGHMIFFNAANSPRMPEVITAWTTPSFPGFTCATLYQPGTLVLVERLPE